jgi:hypothetical protein
MPKQFFQDLACFYQFYEFLQNVTTSLNTLANIRKLVSFYKILPVFTSFYQFLQVSTSFYKLVRVSTSFYKFLPVFTSWYEFSLFLPVFLRLFRLAASRVAPLASGWRRRRRKTWAARSGWQIWKKKKVNYTNRGQFYDNFVCFDVNAWALAYSMGTWLI